MGQKDLLRRGSPLPHRPAVPVERRRVTSIIGSRQHLSTVTCANRNCLPVCRRTTKLSCPIPLGPKWVAARHGAIWSRLRKSVVSARYPGLLSAALSVHSCFLSPNGSSIRDGPPSESNISRRPIRPTHTGVIRLVTTSAQFSEPHRSHHSGSLTMCRELCGIGPSGRTRGGPAATPVPPGE